MGEVEKRGGSGPLLALKEHRNEGREQVDGGGDLLRLRAGDMRQSLPAGSVPYLIVILDVAEKPIRREIRGRAAVSAPAGALIGAVEHVVPLERVRHHVERSEVSVVAPPLPGNEGVYRVVEVVAPLRAQTVAARLGTANHLRIVEVALGDHDQPAAELPFETVDRAPELLEEVQRRLVVEGMNRVHAQPVGMIVAQPHTRVINEETSNFIASRAVEVDGRAPGRSVALGEIGAELVEVVSLGAEVVVNDIYEDGEPLPMRRIDEPLDPVRATVSLVRGEEVDPVVSPPPRSGGGGKRHELHVGHAQVDEVVQSSGRRLERSFVGEGAGMKFVNERAGERHLLKPRITPPERIVAYPQRRAVHPFRLTLGPRIRPRISPVDGERVGYLREVRPHLGLPVSPLRPLHRIPLFIGYEVNAGRLRRPYLDSLRHCALTHCLLTHCHRPPPGQGDKPVPSRRVWRPALCRRRSARR